MSFHCPKCRGKINYTTLLGFSPLFCSNCGGHFVHIEDINDALGIGAVNLLKKLEPTDAPPMLCPIDNHEMKMHRMHIGNEHCNVGLCGNCHGSWYDSDRAFSAYALKNSPAQKGDQSKAPPKQNTDKIEKQAQRHLDVQEANQQFLPPSYQMTENWIDTICNFLSIIPVKGRNQVYNTAYITFFLSIATVALLLVRGYFEWTTFLLIVKTNLTYVLYVFALIILFYEKVITAYVVYRYGANLEDRLGRFNYLLGLMGNLCLCLGIELLLSLYELNWQASNLALENHHVVIITGCSASFILGTYATLFPNARIQMLGFSRKPLILRAKSWPFLWLLYNLVFALTGITVIPWLTLGIALLIGLVFGAWAKSKVADRRLNTLQTMIKNQQTDV